MAKMKPPMMDMGDGMPKPPKPGKMPGMPNFGARAKRPGGMAKGGKVHEDAAMDRKLIREELAKKGMKKGGKVPMPKAFAMKAMMKGKR